jgi:hypothetical protein
VCVRAAVDEARARGGGGGGGGVGFAAGAMGGAAARGHMPREENRGYALHTPLSLFPF